MIFEHGDSQLRQKNHKNTFLFQYCEYYPDYETCKKCPKVQKWLEQNMPEKFSQMGLGGGEATTAAETDEDAKKRQKRGGKGMY